MVTHTPRPRNNYKGSCQLPCTCAAVKYQGPGKWPLNVDPLWARPGPWSRIFLTPIWPHTKGRSCTCFRPWVNKLAPTVYPKMLKRCPTVPCVQLTQISGYSYLWGKSQCFIVYVFVSAFVVISFLLESRPHLQLMGLGQKKSSGPRTIDNSDLAIGPESRWLRRNCQLMKRARGFGSGPIVSVSLSKPLDLTNDCPLLCEGRLTNLPKIGLVRAKWSQAKYK